MSQSIKTLKDMLESGVNNIYNHYPKIDKLNVFPIPDGDTGTNMNLTCTNGFADLENGSFENVGDLMAKFSRGLIMSARGNSGVIFSQIIKGFANGLSGQKETSPEIWVKAFEQAKISAYDAVMKPVEGTILTVIRETSESISKTFEENPTITEKKLWEAIIAASNVSLDNTPELLPVLKKVGVVDSGGFGLVKFFEGMEKFLRTKKILARSKKLEENEGGNVEMELDDEEFGYCTEAVVLLSSDYIGTVNVKEIRSTFESFGNSSIVVVADGNILKTHTHALKPGIILETLQKYGEFEKIKVENMTLQSDKHVKGGNPSIKKGSNDGKTMTIIDSEVEKPRRLLKDTAVISVVPSKDILDYFKEELQVDYVINGGSKMNPSTKHFIKAIAEVDAKEVYILPNDSNILMAANQAKSFEKKSKVHVIPTKSVVAGMVAYLNLDKDENFKKNSISVNKALKDLVSVSISTASRDVKLNGVNIKSGNLLALVNEKIFASSKEISDILKKVFDKYITPKTEIITIFQGTEATFKEVNFLKKYLDENFDVEYEIINGGQDIYKFFIAIE